MITLALAFATVPADIFWLYLVVAVVAIGSSILMVRARKRLIAKGREPESLHFMLRQSKYPRNAPAVLGIIVIGLIGWFWIATRDTPWMPIERISQSASQPIIGYVLDDDGEWFTVMLEDSRRAVTIPSAQISNREPCSLRDGRPPLVSLIWPKAPDYPDC